MKGGGVDLGDDPVHEPFFAAGVSSALVWELFCEPRAAGQFPVAFILVAESCEGSAKVSMSA